MPELTDFQLPYRYEEASVAVVRPDIGPYGSPGNGSWIYRSDSANRGTLVAGSLAISSDITVERIRIYSGQFQINEFSAADLGAFFGSGGAGNDITVTIQTDDAIASFDVDETSTFNVGGNWIRWNAPSEFLAISNGLSTGDEFILAFTRFNASIPEITFTTDAANVAGESVTTISGTVSDVEDDDSTLTVTLSTTLGTLSSVTRSGNTWSATLTAPSQTIVTQDMTVTATVTDSDDNSSSRSRTWTVNSSAPTFDDYLVQSFDLGDALTQVGREWTGAILIEPEFVVDGDAAYLRRVSFTGTNSIRLETASTADGTPGGSGPQLTDAVEGYVSALRFVDSSDDTITIPGPNHSTNSFSDSTEPYFWTAPSGTNWGDLDSGNIRLEMRDGTTLANVNPTITFTTATATVEGLSVTNIAGTVNDAEDDNSTLSVSLATTVGTLSDVTRSGSNWSATLTAPAVTANAQNMNVTATVTDSGGKTGIATRTWVVRANQSPTITLDQNDQGISANGTLAITATTTAPETGQTVTVAWEALDEGTVSPTTGNTTTFTAPSVPTVQNLRVRATATDNLGGTATATVTLTIAVPPVITFTTPASTVEGLSVTTITGTATDVDGVDADLTVSLSTTLGTLSAVTRSGSTWSATLTAPAVTTSIQTMTVTATVTDDDSFTGTATRTWTVRANQPPTLTLDQDSQDIAGNGTLDITATTTGPESNQSVTIAWSAPDGGTVSPTTGTSTTFTAPAMTDAEQNLRVRAVATDSLGSTTTREITLRVPPPNENPTITFTTPTSVVEGLSVTTISGTVSDAEDDNATLDIQLSTTLGTTSAVTHTGNTWSATLTAPAVAVAQQDMVVTATVTDSENATGTATRTWNVRANRPPTISLDIGDSTIEGGASQAITATTTSPESNQTVTVAWSTDLGTVSPTTGTSTTFTAPQPTTTTQTATVRAVATDSLGATGESEIEFTVEANKTPTISLDQSDQELEGGTTLSITATTTAPETGQSVTVTWSAPDGGTVSPTTGTSTTFTAPAAVDAEQTARVTATATDAVGATATETITLTIPSANEAPTITIDTETSTIDGLATVAISGTVDDVDDENDTLVVTLSTTLGSVSTATRSGSNWSATLTAPGVAASQQQVVVTATVTDAAGDTGTATQMWTVRSNQNPTIVLNQADQVIVSGTTLRISSTTTGIETDQTVTVGWEAPDGGTLSATTGTSVNFTAPSGTGTSYRVTATATDNLGATATATVTLRTVSSLSTTLSTLTLSATHNSITGVWNPVHDAVAYAVDYKRADSSTWISISGLFVLGNTVTIPSLTPHTEYDVRVGPLITGETNYTTRSITTPGHPNAPGVPTSVMATATNNSITVTWAAPTTGGTPTGYYLQRTNPPSDPTGWYLAGNPGADATSHTISTLGTELDYMVRIRARNADGNSEWVTLSISTLSDTNYAPGQPSYDIEVTHNTITLTLTANPVGGTPTSYEAQYKLSSETTWTTASDTSSPIVISGLTPSETYDFRVRGVNSGGNSAWNTGSTGLNPDPDLALPGAPTSVAATATSNSLTVTWSAPTTGGTPTGYDVGQRFRADNPNTGWNTFENATSPYVITDAISHSQNYQVRVRAKNAMGNGVWSSVVDISTPLIPNAPGVPTSVLVFHISNDSIGLSWLAPTTGGTVENYEVQYKKDSETTWVDATGVGTTGVTITGLDSNTMYNMRVRASNAGGDSAWVTADATTQIDAPGVPTNVGVTATTDSITVTWSAPTGGSDGVSYELQYKLDTSSTYTPVSQQTITVTSYTISSLTADTAYDIRIQAVTNGGRSDWVERSITTPAVTPDAPGEIRVYGFTVSDVDSVTAVWTNPVGGGAATSYSIRWKDSTETTYPTANIITGITLQRQTVTMLDPATYHFQIAGVNAGGQGPWSPDPPASVVVAGAQASSLDDIRTTPSTPMRLSAEATSAGVVLTWVAPEADGGEDITGYNVWRWDSVRKWVEVVDNTNSTATTYTDTSTLTEDTRYWYNIRAINSEGAGEWSGSRSVLIRVSKPGMPRRLVADAQTAGVVLDWLEPLDTGSGGVVTGYNIWRWHHSTLWTEVVDNTMSTDTDYTDTSTLVEGDRYWYNIRAINSSGDGEWSGNAFAIINPSKPAPPRRLLADAQSTGVVLDWLAPVESGSGGAITGYNIWRWHADSLWSEIVEDTGSATTHYTDTTTTLIEGDRYWYIIRAINNSGEGDWSENASAVINPSKPSAPRRLTLEESNAGINLNWLEPLDSGTGGAITDYKIWRKSGSGDWSSIATISSMLTAYQDTSTLSAGWHTYAVVAVNADGDGEWSETSSVTTATDVPSPPTSLTAVIGSTGITLTWAAPLNTGGETITGYRVWRNDGTSWTQLTSNAGVSVLTYVDTDTLGDGLYFYRVQAVTTNGAGDFSGVTQAVIGQEDADPTPSPPRRLAADAQSTGVVLTWLAPATEGSSGAITGYEIHRSDGGAFTKVHDNDTTLTWTDTATLVTGATYFYAVRAVNPGGAGEWSGSVAVIINSDVPSAPLRLVVVGTDDGFVLTWEAPADNGTGGAITGYEVWRTTDGTWAKVTDLGVVLTYTDAEDLTSSWIWWAVRAVNASGAGEWSESVGITSAPPEDGVAEAPTGLVAFLTTGNAVELSWVEPSVLGTGTHSGYQVECFTPSTGWFVCLEDTESTDANVTLPSSTATGVHLFRVAALTDVGVGAFSLPASVMIFDLSGPSGNRKTLGDSSLFAPSKIMPPAVRFLVVVKDRSGANITASNMFDIQPEWWSWTSQGGSDSAVITVGTESPTSLAHVLGWLNHDIFIIHPGTGHVVWSGYVNSASVPIGDFSVRRSLESYANDLRIKWRRPATEHQGEVSFVHSANNDEAAWQQSRYGIRSVVVESDQTLVDLDQDDVDRLLSEYQNAIGIARMDQDIPAGARLECRGHAGRLDQRFFPTRSAGQYGTVTTRDEDERSRIQYRIDNNPAAPHASLFQYADMNPLAGYGHGPHSPTWDQYLRTVRFQGVSRQGNSSKQRMIFGVYALGTGDAPGAELSPSRVRIGYEQQQNVAKSPNQDMLTINWVADGDPLLKLPSGGWYFGFVDDSELHDSGFNFSHSTARYWDAAQTNSGRMLLVRQNGSGNYVVSQDHLCFDFFVGVTAEGLIRWMEQDADLSQGILGAHPANAAGGRFGSQASMYYEGDVAWRQAVNQMAAADRLCYAVDENKLLRFWSADDHDSAPIKWSGGGSNMGAFIGRRVLLGQEEFLLTGASYDAMTGQVDFSTAGQPSATVAGLRLGDVT